MSICDPKPVATTSESSAALNPYEADPGYYDEAVTDEGTARDASRPVLETLRGRDLDELRRDLRADVRDAGIGFHSVDGDSAFNIDPVPRIITRAEWEPLEAGLVQRVRALDAFIADVYGAQEILAAQIVPRWAVESADHFEPGLVGHVPAGGTWIGIAGLDIVRDASGEFLVLEDNLRTPSGPAYIRASRWAVQSRLGRVEPAPRPLDGLADLLCATLHAAAPADAREDGEPRVVVLTDGYENSAYWEHQWIASHLHVPLAEPDELEVRGGRLWLRRRHERELRPVDVVYRRTDEDRFEDPVGQLLAGPLELGTVGVVNGFGTGVADDKLLHAYVEEMVRFYLGEEPLVRSVATYDLSRADVREDVLARIDELVIKPRTGHGGIGIVVCPHADAEDVERIAGEVRAAPETFVAQELVALSRHPTVVDGRLAPRHVDLRPFVFTAGDDVRVLPGGLTRVAFGEGAIVVNSSQNGGAKDTWVLP